jgi:hypothetical protein
MERDGGFKKTRFFAVVDKRALLEVPGRRVQEKQK